MTFVDVWLGYTVFGVAVFSLMFAWAVRARQFSDMDRGRHIPLAGERETERAGDVERRPGAVDRYTWIVLALLTAAALAFALVIGMRCT